MEPKNNYTKISPIKLLRSIEVHFRYLLISDFPKTLEIQTIALHLEE